MSSTALTLTEIGIDQDELQDRLVQAIASGLMEGTARDEDGMAYPRATEFAQGLRQKLEDAIGAQVEAIAEQHVIPHVGDLIENAALQRTNEWAEKVGEPLTFTQYLIQRAEAYLTEPVDHDGKPLERGRHHSGRKQQTRLTHLVDRHLHYRIETAMKEAVKNANEVLVGALAETVKIKLAEIAASLRVGVTT